MPDPLVTDQDLIDRKASISSIDPTEVASAIADASASVRLFTGQILTPATSTFRLKVRNGKIRVPQRPIVEVTSITDLAGNPVTFTVNDGDQIDVRTQVFDTWSMVPYSTPINEVDVTYDHGFDPMHEAIVSVTCQVALRVLTSDVEDAGVQDEALGSYRVGYGSVGASGPSGLFAGEKEILRQFRRPLGSMQVFGS